MFKKNYNNNLWNNKKITKMKTENNNKNPKNYKLKT